MLFLHCNFCVRVFVELGFVLLIRPCPSLCLALPWCAAGKAPLAIGDIAVGAWAQKNVQPDGPSRGQRKSSNPIALGVGKATRAIGDIGVGSWAQKIVQPDGPSRGHRHPCNWRHRSRGVGSEIRLTRRTACGIYVWVHNVVLPDWFVCLYPYLPCCAVAPISF